MTVTSWGEEALMQEIHAEGNAATVDMAGAGVTVHRQRRHGQHDHQNYATHPAMEAMNVIVVNSRPYRGNVS